MEIALTHHRCQFGARVRVLLHFKVDATIANQKQELPLHRACGSDSNMEVGVVSFFTLILYVRSVYNADSHQGLSRSLKQQRDFSGGITTVKTTIDREIFVATLQQRKLKMLKKIKH